MKEILIESRQNPTVQLAVRLQKSAKFRREQGLFAADGTKLLTEAARWGSLHTVFLAPGADCGTLPDNVTVCRVSDSLMKSMSLMDTPQGALFLCRLPEPEPPEVRPGCLVLDGVQDPGNVGTILRTADALEIPVLLTEGCADPFSPKVVRASMGAVFRTRPVQTLRQDVIRQCREKQIRLAVTALSDTAQDIRQLPLGSCAVVIGSEGRGVCENFLEEADLAGIIPMNPRCESLNAGIAAAIVMWQMKQPAL